MKKIISLALSIVMITAVIVCGLVPAGAETYIEGKGDVNSDGFINALDATMVLQNYSGIIRDSTPGYEISAADVNDDGIVNATDATMILQVYAGIDPNSPVKSDPDDSNDPDGDVPAEVMRILELVNMEREKENLSPLTLNLELTKNANLRAEEIVEKFEHVRPDGTACFTAFTVEYNYAGENIASRFSTPEAVMNAWMNSPGHRGNIMSSNFSQIGIGICVKSGVYYWTQLFIG